MKPERVLENTKAEIRAIVRAQQRGMIKRVQVMTRRLTVNVTRELAMYPSEYTKIQMVELLTLVTRADCIPEMVNLASCPRCEQLMDDDTVLDHVIDHGPLVRPKVLTEGLR